jgi:hypothetical protein
MAMELEKNCITLPGSGALVRADFSGGQSSWRNCSEPPLKIA